MEKRKTLGELVAEAQRAHEARCAQLEEEQRAYLEAIEEKIRVGGTTATPLASRVASIASGCAPTNPCNSWACPQCGGPQPNISGNTLHGTPPYGSPMFAGSCGGCGSATCNQCRAARGMGPAGVTPRPGAVKPGGGRAVRRPSESGYRVCSYDAYLNAKGEERPGATVDDV